MKNKLISLSLALLCSLTFKANNMEKDTDAMNIIDEHEKALSQAEQETHSSTEKKERKKYKDIDDAEGDVVAIAQFLEDEKALKDIDVTAVFMNAISQHRDLKLMKLALEKGAQMYDRAFENGHAMGAVLSGLNQNELDPGDEIPLLEDLKKQAQLLLDHGYDLNHHHYQYLFVPLATPGIASAYDGALLDFLIEKGANVNRISPSQLTPLLDYLNQQYSREEIMPTLHPRQKLHLPPRKEKDSCAIDIKHFHRVGADINFRDADGRTALFYAIDANDPLAVISLWKCGTNINNVDKKGLTPLAYAQQLQQDYIDKVQKEKDTDLECHAILTKNPPKEVSLEFDTEAKVKNYAYYRPPVMKSKEKICDHYKNKMAALPYIKIIKFLEDKYQQLAFKNFEQFKAIVRLEGSSIQGNIENLHKKAAPLSVRAPKMVEFMEYMKNLEQKDTAYTEKTAKKAKK